MDMFKTTSASATLAGEGSCVISLDVLVSYCQGEKLSEAQNV